MEEKNYTTKELGKRFLYYFRPYRRTLALDLLCAALTTVCEIVLPLLIRQITNTALAEIGRAHV